MNQAFLAPFAEALLAAVVDPTVERNENLLALVGSDVYGEKPGTPPTKFVVFDIPFGGRPPAYVHGTVGDPVANWSRFQVTAWATTKYDAIQVMDAVIQAIEGRDLVVSDAWEPVRLFQRLAPQSTTDDISEQRMYGVFARYEVLLVT